MTSILKGQPNMKFDQIAEEDITKDLSPFSKESSKIRTYQNKEISQVKIQNKRLQDSNSNKSRQLPSIEGGTMYI